MYSHAPDGTKTGSHQRRPCFLCGGTAGRQVFDETWDMVGIGPVRIGIRVCSDCGMVLQDPVVGQSELGDTTVAFPITRIQGGVGSLPIERFKVLHDRLPL